MFTLIFKFFKCSSRNLSIRYLTTSCFMVILTLKIMHESKKLYRQHIKFLLFKKIPHICHRKKHKKKIIKSLESWCMTRQNNPNVKMPCYAQSQTNTRWGHTITLCDFEVVCYQLLTKPDLKIDKSLWVLCRGTRESTLPQPAQLPVCLYLCITLYILADTASSPWLDWKGTKTALRATSHVQEAQNKTNFYLVSGVRKRTLKVFFFQKNFWLTVYLYMPSNKNDNELQTMLTPVHSSGLAVLIQYLRSVAAHLAALLKQLSSKTNTNYPPSRDTVLFDFRHDSLMTWFMLFVVSRDPEGRRQTKTLTLTIEKMCVMRWLFSSLSMNKMKKMS